MRWKDMPVAPHLKALEVELSGLIAAKTTRIAITGGRGDGKSNLAKAVIKSLEGVVHESVPCGTYCYWRRLLMAVAIAVRDGLFEAGADNLLVQAANLIRDAVARDKPIVFNNADAITDCESLPKLYKTLSNSFGKTMETDLVQKWLVAFIDDVTSLGYRIVILLDDFDSVDDQSVEPMLRLMRKVKDKVTFVVTTADDKAWVLEGEGFTTLHVEPWSPEDLIKLLDVTEPDPEKRSLLLDGEAGEEVRWLSTVCKSPQVFLYCVNYASLMGFLTRAKREVWVRNDAFSAVYPLTEEELEQLIRLFPSSRESMAVAEIGDQEMLAKAFKITAVYRVDSRSDDAVVLSESLHPLRAILEGR